MIRYRLARPDDITTCVRFIADHPVLAAEIWACHRAFGDRVASLSRLGCPLQHRQRRDGLRSATRLIGAYIASFVSDDFASELATPPLKWIGPELVNRCIHGPVPILTDAEVRQANSTSGMNILVWPTAPRADFENLPELVQGGQSLFFETYRGFNIKRLQVQASHPVEMAVAVNSGAWCLRAGDAVHFRTLEQPAEVAFLQPHMLEVTKEMAARQPGTWVSLLLTLSQACDRIHAQRAALALGRPARWNGWRVSRIYSASPCPR